MTGCWPWMIAALAIGFMAGRISARRRQREGDAELDRLVRAACVQVMDEQAGPHPGET